MKKLITKIDEYAYLTNDLTEIIEKERGMKIGRTKDE